MLTVQLVDIDNRHNQQQKQKQQRQQHSNFNNHHSYCIGHYPTCYHQSYLMPQDYHTYNNNNPITKLTALTFNNSTCLNNNFIDSNIIINHSNKSTFINSKKNHSKYCCSSSSSSSSSSSTVNINIYSNSMIKHHLDKVNELRQEEVKRIERQHNQTDNNNNNSNLQQIKSNHDYEYDPIQIDHDLNHSNQYQEQNSLKTEKSIIDENCIEKNILTMTKLIKDNNNNNNNHDTIIDNDHSILLINENNSIQQKNSIDNIKPLLLGNLICSSDEMKNYQIAITQSLLVYVYPQRIILILLFDHQIFVKV
ncbi:unnamed protein product [Schistosoma margrebowiei]|uniref:Uncharacterized protein n=1 Tax=Schistosoma margrebowiei TaxID=48269 RepID=A0A183LW63_9TREM|nr:unnamed protein product [Schistosoma margrebowiei]